MLKIGLTGSIGSGKTTVSRIFALLGVPLYSADYEARKLLTHDKRIHVQLRTLFGHTIFTEGHPDRQRLAALVFSDPDALKQLNALIHPAVAADFQLWLPKQQQAAYVIKEAAILFESGAHHGLDHVIAVTAPEPLRRERTLSRYETAPEQFELRQKNQWTEAEKAALADFIIRNDEQALVIPQVLALHKKFTS